MYVNVVESQSPGNNLLEKSAGGAMLPLEVKKSFKWGIGSVESAPAKVYEIKTGTPVIYDSSKKQFIIDAKHVHDKNLSALLKKYDCIVAKDNVYKSHAFRKITVIPKYVMRGEDGFEYSPYGAKRYPSDKLVKTDKYTWEVIDKDGTLRIGLGKPPAKSLDEAVKMAKDLENTGMYYYMGIREDKDMSKSSINNVIGADNENQPASENEKITLPIESKDSLPGVNDVVTKIDEETLPGKIIIEFESGKAVTVDITNPDSVADDILNADDNDIDTIDEESVTGGAIVLAWPNGNDDEDSEKFNINFLCRLANALKKEINESRRKNIIKMIKDTVKKIEKAVIKVNVEAAYSGDVRNKQEALDALNALASFLKIQNADNNIRDMIAKLGISIKKMPVKL